MRPPVPGAGLDAPLLARVRAWCDAGALPRMTQPWSVACIAPHPGLDAVACEIDGSRRLMAMGRWQGRAWRALVLLRDHLPGRALQPGDPWDCGWWRPGPLDAARAFRPRRATLLMVQGVAGPEPEQPEPAEALIETLQAQAGAYAWPVRLLLVTSRRREGLARL